MLLMFYTHHLQYMKKKTYLQYFALRYVTLRYNHAITTYYDLHITIHCNYLLTGKKNL